MKNIAGIYLFQADSGISLYSRKTVNVEEDLFSAFLSALKQFFNSFALGGLSTFASENFIFYLASGNNVLTAIIVDNKNKSDRYFNLAFKINTEFYNQFKNIVDSKFSVKAPNKELFDPVLDKTLAQFDKTPEEHQELIKLYKVLSSGELEQFSFFSERQLYELTIFVAVNFVTKHIFVVENYEESVSSRLLFMASNAVSNMNQREFKSEFAIRNVSDPWDMERVIQQISKLLRGEALKI